ncbi:hypothetical protein ABZ297_44340 [Nonomuraea sp. NPDC005983]|uniref:hypothetical protein n=1 Tax=Nonomuraea sp. NPDC005983 TaxID=3155595 RepID=UPI0033B3485D
MIPDGPELGQMRRGALALVALGVTVLIIYGLFASGFGRLHRAAVAGASGPVVDPVGAGLAGGGVSGPTPAQGRTTLAVISDDFWLTYLPAGLERTGGGVIRPEPGVEGGWAKFSSTAGVVEAQVEHGTVAADWDTYRARNPLRNARNSTIRGKPAMVGETPDGGQEIVWLERAGTGAWIKVSRTLSEELLPIAASVEAPVGN